MTVIDDDQLPLVAARTTALWAGIGSSSSTSKQPPRKMAARGVPLPSHTSSAATDRCVPAATTSSTQASPSTPNPSRSTTSPTTTSPAKHPSLSLAHVILGAFESHAGEEPIVVAHNVGFDVGVLRTECALAGVELPELRTLDTMRLAPHVGVSGRQPKLSELCELLGVINLRPHDAHADAVPAPRSPSNSSNTQPSRASTTSTNCTKPYPAPPLTPSKPPPGHVPATDQPPPSPTPTSPATPASCRHVPAPR